MRSMRIGSLRSMENNHMEMILFHSAAIDTCGK